MKPPKPLPPANYSARLKILQKRLLQQDLNASAGLLVTNPRDIRYLTGFVGDDSWALVPLAGKKIHILSDNRFEEQIQREAPQASAHMRKNGLAEELAQVARSLQIKTVCLQPGYITLAQQHELRKRAQGLKFVSKPDGLLKQRALKDAGEIAAIRQAIAMQQQALVELRRFIKPGVTESLLAAELEYLMRSLGADGPSFNTIIAADANASLPHAIPGSRKVKKGGIVLIDWGAKYQGYCSDMTRVLAVGKWPAKIKEIYQICLEAQLAGIAAIRPGVSVKAVDAAARDVIKKAGYGERFGHGLGHGIGYDIHELPSLSWRSDEPLEINQIVTVEPGIYLPGIGGVRIEDDVLVQKSGREVMCNLPKSLDWAVV